MKLCLLSLLLAAPCSLASVRSFVAYRSRGLQQGLISPKLDPTSDKVFFGEDYPGNAAPKGKVNPELGQPYPAVQKPIHFETDYVKDENNDDGEWRRQMEYDMLRTKESREKEEMEKAKAMEKRLKEAMEEAKANEAAAAKKTEEAAERAEKARAEAKSAQEDAATAKEDTGKAADEQIAEEQHQAAERSTIVKQGAKTEAAGKHQKEPESDAAASSGKGHSNKVDKAVEKVHKEMADLANCRKELSDARDRLKELMEIEKELMSKRREQQDQEKTEQDEESAKLRKEESTGSSELSDREKDITKLREKEQVYENRLSKQEAYHQVAEQHLKEKARDLEKLEIDLKAAEKKLCEHRQSAAAGGDGSDAEKPAGQTQLRLGRSGAAQHSICVVLTALIVVMFM